MICRARARAFCAPAVFAMLAVTGLAACDSSAIVAPTTSAPVTPTTVAPRVEDGILRIGVLLPDTGEGASIGASELAAVRVAVDRAREAEGVDGLKIELIVRNEGPDAVTANVGLQQLIGSNIDVMIGPAASNNAIALAPAIVQAGIAACSPSASALALDDFPDDGLLFRTIPSDSLQADAIAEVIEQTGETSAAIVYVDDGYGRPFEEAVDAALRKRGIAVDDVVGFDVEDSEFTVEAERVLAAGDGAIALIGDPDAGSRVLAALAQEMGDTPRDIVVNDALRRPFSINLLAAIGPGTRERIVGVSADVRLVDAELLDAIAEEDGDAGGLFASQAFDCANLFMIAAAQTGSTQADVLKAVIPDISTAGSSCATFDRCIDLLTEARNINYDGPSGRLVLASNGDPAAAVFDVFGFDDTGRDTSLRPVIVGER